MSEQDFDQNHEAGGVPDPSEDAPVNGAQSESAGEEAVEAADPNALPGMDWFIIHTYSGFENKVAESLRARAAAYAFSDRLGQILIPTEEVVELRNGKKVTSKRLLYPGYVMEVLFGFYRVSLLTLAIRN
ncbi:MAG: transcription termination/antitermination NusG family protein [Paludibaculum sp.]